jgi:hypothetical protein
MRWKVSVMRDMTEFGVVFVEAESSEDAVRLAIDQFSGPDNSCFVTDHDARQASVRAVEAAGGDE